MKKSGWVKSVVALITVVAVLGGAGFFLLTDGQETPLAANRLEAEVYAQSENLSSGQAEENGSGAGETAARASEEAPVSSISDQDEKADHEPEHTGLAQEQATNQDAQQGSTQEQQEQNNYVAAVQPAENGQVQTVSTPAPVKEEVASSAGNSNQA